MDWVHPHLLCVGTESLLTTWHLYRFLKSTASHELQILHKRLLQPSFLSEILWEEESQSFCLQFIFLGIMSFSFIWAYREFFFMVFFHIQNPTKVRKYQFSSVQFSRSVVSDTLWPHELQHARPPCPSPTPGVRSNSHPSSPWCHPAISSSVVPFSSCPQSFPASESFPMSQLFAWGGQSIGVPALASFLPKNTQDWSPLEWTGWISLQSKGLPRVFSNTTVQKHQFFSAHLISQSDYHIHTWPLEKP